MMEKIQEVMGSTTFAALVDEYSPLSGEEGPITFQTIAAERIQHLNNNSLLVPVLGVQGVGKSSFLNALIMDDPVLPIDADETTCIPVEIVYSADQEKTIAVFFQDGRRVVLKRGEDLDEYVNNAKNPGNKKNVSHALVESNSSILKNNVILVDLPGIGSTTENNMETTMNYIKKITAAIILIRTVPPITQQEKLFLTSLWHKLSSAWFLQNRWMDESQAEVEDGMAHNKKILEEIAQKRGDSSQKEIEVVNVYQAWKAHLEQDDQAYKDSGITDIQTRITDMAANWKETLYAAQLSFLQDLIRTIRHNIKEKEAENGMSRDELRKRYRKFNDEQEEIFYNNRKKLRDIDDLISKKERMIRDLVYDESRTKTEELRAEMRRLTYAGLTDGQHLSQAFEEKQKTLIEDFLITFTNAIWELERDLTNEIGELEIRKPDGDIMSVENYNNNEKLKWEKVLPIIGTAGGAWAAKAVGAKVGAMIGAKVGALGGPVGSVAGAIAGGLVVLVGGWLGGKGKQAIKEQRAGKTMQELQPYIDNFRSNTEAMFLENLREITGKMREGLVQFKKDQEETLEREKAKQEQELKKSQEDKEETLKKLKLDNSHLNYYQELVNSAYASIAR